MMNSTATQTVKVRISEAHVQDAEGNAALGGRMLEVIEAAEGDRLVVSTPMGPVAITVERGMDGFACAGTRIGSKGIYVSNASIDWDRQGLL